MDRNRTSGGRARAGERARLSISEVQPYLDGMDYPARPRELSSHARERGAPELVAGILEGVEDREYRSPADLARALGRTD